MPRRAASPLSAKTPDPKLHKDEVFMRDAAQKELFERDYRFLSHGCLRVDGVHDLATWLLQASEERDRWDQAALRKEVEEGKTETIKLARPVPVAWAT